MARSVTPSRWRASHSQRYSCHFSIDVSGAISRALAWVANMASVIDRRPKGVVTSPLCIFFTSQKAIEKRLPKRRRRLLTTIRGNAILKLLRDERGFHDGNVWGPFSFCDETPRYEPP